MKPITFENLRRLVGGGRKKERQESSFKRSDSFKRISIRRNYLENRGGGGRSGRDAPAEKKRHPPKADVVEEKKEIDVPESLVIGYGQWIKCMKAEDYEALKELKRDVPPTPPPRKKHDTSSLEIVKLDTSPAPVRRRYRKSTPPAPDRDSGLSISLGRVWMDAPLAMANAPRSLELPRNAAVETDPSGRRVHRSLESALKERHDGRFMHLHQKPLMHPTAVCRTLSSTQTTSTSKTTSSRGSHELLSSSKDSGFSFSISIPRLSDLSPTSSGGGFFSKNKKQPKTTREFNYFKRTTNFTQYVEQRGSVKKKNRKKSVDTTTSNDMYQVVVGRPPRSLDSLKLDPMIFVPPERRTRRNDKRYEVTEIRDYCSPADLKDDSDEGLYECISEDDERIRRRQIEPPRRSAIRFTASDDDDDDDEYAPVYEDDIFSHVSGRRVPVRRKKSVKKGVVKYVARPSIHRAPSTLKRNKKLLKK
ncbi:unnamed protein product, partial [Nesidiocoris tenuis]